MNDIIKKHREMVAERLAQGFSPVHRDTLSKAQEGFDDLEKARVVRQDGDIHPNGKWVWSSQAAGGKGDWRVIKKPKDGSPSPSPDKKETKSANAPSLSSEALIKTLENMSAEDLIKLQSLIASAVAKKTKSADVTKESGEKMSQAIGSVLAQGIKATKRYNVAPDGSPIDLTKLPDQNIITGVVLAQQNVDRLAYEATLGGGKKKQEKIAQELEDQRGLLAELQEEANKRGLKNESSKKVDDEEHTPQTYGHEVFDREAADKAFNDEVKRVVDASALKDPASKSGAVEMLTAAKERFGDKVRVELHNPSRNPTAMVDFGNGLELGFSYRNDGYTYTFWKLSGYEEEFAMKLKERGFDVRNYNDSPITRLDYEIDNVRANLRRINNEDDEFAWTINLNRLKAIKNKLEREFKTFRP